MTYDEFISQWNASWKVWSWDATCPGETFLEAVQLAWRRIYGTEMPELPEPFTLGQEDKRRLWYNMDGNRFVLANLALFGFQIRELHPTYLIWNTTYDTNQYPSNTYPNVVLHARDDDEALTLAALTATRLNWRRWFLSSQDVHLKRRTILFSLGGIPWTSLNSKSFFLPSETKPAFVYSDSSLPPEMFS